MSVIYIDGTDGSDLANGLAAVAGSGNGPLKTLNAAEDLPVVPGDLVHVRSGVYRETLTCDVSGTLGNVIEYRGDYAGLIWAGGGVVRVTGSDDDVTATRDNGIVVNTLDYRKFSGLSLDGFFDYSFKLTDCTYVEIMRCSVAVGSRQSCAIENLGDDQATLYVHDCLLVGPASYGLIYFEGFQDAAGHRIENCILWGGGTSVAVYLYEAIAGVAVTNCLIYGGAYGCYVEYAPAAGALVVRNSVFVGQFYSGLEDNDKIGAIDSDYNTVISGFYVGVTPGANDRTDLPLFDVRWFFELVNGGNILSPFDLASYSPLINIAGATAPTADMRGTTIIGANRELGPLEYDATLLIASAAGGGGGVPVIGGHVVRRT